ncbi:MAG: conjugative transposon protein TraM, partial [Chitinophagaceae bacterium]
PLTDIWIKEMKMQQREFIQGMIDQTLVGYAGSRVTIKLLSEVRVGATLLKKGTLLYALISGFSPQRVLLNISSIAFNEAAFADKNSSLIILFWASIRGDWPMLMRLRTWHRMWRMPASITSTASPIPISFSATAILHGD